MGTFPPLLVTEESQRLTDAVILFSQVDVHSLGCYFSQSPKRLRYLPVVLNGGGYLSTIWNLKGQHFELFQLFLICSCFKGMAHELKEFSTPVMNLIRLIAKFHKKISSPSETISSLWWHLKGVIKLWDYISIKVYSVRILCFCLLQSLVLIM